MNSRARGIRIKTNDRLQLPELLLRKFLDSMGIEAFARFANLIKASWNPLGMKRNNRIPV